MWTNIFSPPFEILGKIAKKMRTAKVLEKPSQDFGFLRYTCSTPHLRQSYRIIRFTFAVDSVHRNTKRDRKVG